jgi:hypothetical protein
MTPAPSIGDAAMQFATQIAGFVPVAGPFIQGGLQFAQQLDALFSKIHAGADEADIIVHDSQSGQNALMAYLGTITNAFLVGSNPSVQQLQQMYIAVAMAADSFKRFVLSSQFKDRRASGQALNTVMPYIDGTCGYAVPLGQSATPSQPNCGLSWGDGTLGGVGTNGMLGALSRAIRARGGVVPSAQVGPSVLTNQGGIPTLQVPGQNGLPPMYTVNPLPYYPAQQSGSFGSLPLLLGGFLLLKAVL